MEKLVVATHNEGKMDEIREILSHWNIEFLSLNDIGLMNFEIEEDALTFEGNALIKAREAKIEIDRRNLINGNYSIIADDSGICIYALDERPGIYTSRYGGDTDYKTKRAMILEEMDGIVDRTAYFACAIAFLSNNIEKTFTGYVHGLINDIDIGDNGFGYDSIFFYRESGMTFGQLEEKEKHKVSHRKNALYMLEEFLKNENISL